MAEFRSEQWPIEKLQGWNKNPRGIMDEDYKRLKQQIQKLGMYKPLLVDTGGTVLGGNMRLKVLSDLGVKQVWVSVVEPKDDSERLEYALSDNDRAGYYETQELAEMVELNPIDLKLYKVDIAKSITVDDVVARYGPEPDEDEPPDVDEESEPTSKLGEVYQLGAHRLMCGDATDGAHVQTLMGGVQADMVWTDPPYNVNYSGRGKNTSNTIQGDHEEEAEFRQFLESVFANYRALLKSTGGLYTCYASRTHREFEDALNSAGFSVRNQIIWVKTVASMGWGHYRWKHEPILYCGIEGEKTEFYGDRKNYTEWQEAPTDKELFEFFKEHVEVEERGGSTVWRISRESNYDHPTQKPVRLINKALKNSSKREAVVADLFAGSGSTLSACEQTGRVCYTMELDPKYADVVRKRYAKLAGIDDWQEATPRVDAVEVNNE